MSDLSEKNITTHNTTCRVCAMLLHGMQASEARKRCRRFDICSINYLKNLFCQKENDYGRKQKLRNTQTRFIPLYILIHLNTIPTDRMSLTLTYVNDQISGQRFCLSSLFCYEHIYCLCLIIQTLSVNKINRIQKY